MDRNSAIGLTLIAALLLMYFYYFSPEPVPPAPASQPLTTETPVDTTSAVASTTPSVTDSLLSANFGTVAPLATGTEQETKVENADLALTFTNNGKLKVVELKNFKTYYQKPLLLVAPGTSTQQLNAQVDGRNVDLWQLYYQGSVRKTGDSTRVEYVANLDNGAFIKHIYTVPATGFKINYRLQTSRVSLNGDYVTYQWNNKLPLVEKDLTDSRNKTTINFYSAVNGFDGLSETSQDVETEALPATQWVAIRQKFFISSVLTNSQFTGGEVSTRVNPADTSTVKEASVKVFIPGSEITGNGASLAFFFGPNDYSLTPDVATEFSRNLYLGWPPVRWVNQYLIVPLFSGLEGITGNYGIIIIILVFIIKLALAPLSYKSYLGMAKMKLLKPELDVIKEKYGDNMTQIQAEQMKLYQQAGVNPFSGCIPLLLQMPFLFAMFYFFPVSIELRQESFLWAEDLSTYDSIINLPFTIPFYGSHVSLFVLLMTASQIVFQWQNNQLTAVQGPMKTMGYIMPVVFMFILNNFAAGLSFYYFVSNLFTFAQQAVIKRFVDEDKIMRVMDEHKKKMATGGGNGKKSNFMSKLEEAMKASQEAKEKNKKK